MNMNSVLEQAGDYSLHQTRRCRLFYRLRELKRSCGAAAPAGYPALWLDSRRLRLFLAFGEIWSVRRARSQLKALATESGGKDRR
jgi:hypothetical protein